MAEEKKFLKIIRGAYGNKDQCAGIVEKEIFPPEGGAYCKLVGCSYLFNRFPRIEIIDLLDYPKDMLSKIPEIIGSMPILVKISFIIQFIFLRIFAKKFLMNVINTYISMAHWPLTKYMLTEKDYCNSIREIFRAFAITLQEVKNNEIRHLLGMIGDIGCMGTEHDTAYRFELQDILPEVDVGDMKKNPIKEVKRVFNIFIERSIQQRERWRKLKKMVILVLRIYKPARDFLIRFFAEIDLEKVKLSEADWYFSLKRDDYNYRDVSFEKRLKIKEKIDMEKGHRIPNVSLRRKGREIEAFLS